MTRFEIAYLIENLSMPESNPVYSIAIQKGYNYKVICLHYCGSSVDIELI